MTAGDATLDRILDLAATRHSLPPGLVLCIAHAESALDTYAIRVEPAYRWLWDVTHRRPFPATQQQAATRVPPANFPAPRGISRSTEWIGQQTSWGLMQVMGAVAREYGFVGHFTALCDPAVGADYGCRHLAQLARRHLVDHGWRGVIQSYNTGSPTSRNNYPARVAAVAAELGIHDVFQERSA